jgi:hypothetical protein
MPALGHACPRVRRRGVTSAWGQVLHRRGVRSCIQNTSGRLTAEDATRRAQREQPAWSPSTRSLGTPSTSPRSCRRSLSPNDRPRLESLTAAVTVGADNFGVFTWHQIYSKIVLHHDEDRTIDLSVLSHKRLLESQELHLATGKIHATGSRLLGDFSGRLLVFDMA